MVKKCKPRWALYDPKIKLITSRFCKKKQAQGAQLKSNIARLKVLSISHKDVKSYYKKVKKPRTVWR